MRDYFFGKKPLFFVFWVSYVVPLFLSIVGIYSIYWLRWGTLMPSVLYNFYLSLVLSLLFCAIYIAGPVVIVTALKQRPHIVIRVGVIVIAAILMLRIPVAFLLDKI